MASVTEEYLNSLAGIYREILAAFPQLEPSRKAGYGLMLPTLFSALRARRSPGEVLEACRQLELGGAVRIKDGSFVAPTPLGEEIIEALTGKKATESHVPPFSPPPGTAG